MFQSLSSPSLCIVKSWKKDVDAILGAADLIVSAVSSYNDSLWLISQTQITFGWSLIKNLVYYDESPSCSIKFLRKLEYDSD